MLEKTLYDYLNTALSVPAYMERPANPPAKFVLIERTGGTGDELVMQATIAVQSIASSMYGAAMLDRKVIAAMRLAQELENIGSVKLVDDYNFTNRYQSDRDEYRYQAVFTVTYYEGDIENGE